MSFVLVECLCTLTGSLQDFASLNYITSACGEVQQVLFVSVDVFMLLAATPGLGCHRHTHHAQPPLVATMPCTLAVQSNTITDYCVL